MTEHSLLYRVFRRDIGRKLTALFLALLVYSAVDQQISDTDAVYVRIAYRHVFDAEVSSADTSWELIVVQRHDENRPLIVPMEGRIMGFWLELSGSKTAIERLNRAPPTLRYYPTRAGLVQVDLDHLDGIDQLRSSLATNGVRFENPLELTFAEVKDAPVTLGREHVEIMGTPLSGWELPPEDLANGLVFNPARVQLTGPKDLVNRIVAGNQPVYRLDVDNKSGIQEMPLRVHDLVKDELSQVGAVLLPDVTIRFVESMVELTGELVDATIHLVVEPRALDPVDQARLAQGEECVIADEDRTRRLQILIPENRVDSEGADGTLKETAKRSVALHVYARDLSADRGRVPIYISKLDDFPSGWDVKLADSPAQDETVLIEWRQVEVEQPGTESGEESSE